MTWSIEGRGLRVKRKRRCRLFTSHAFPATVSGAVILQKILTERDKTCYKGLSVLLLGAMIAFSVLGCRATG
jgi:hypothetical protein